MPCRCARPAFALVGTLAAAALTPAGRLRAQPAASARAAWNDSATLALVGRAEALRRAQLADTALRSYRALARGTVSLLGQLGDFAFIPPRVVQASQVATEVYYEAPGRVTQRVVGVRDTTLLPTDNQFYRDRFGIVVGNFPAVIRLGDGRDVADVPHPLSPFGLEAYDFARGDSLALRVGGGGGAGRVRVVEVRVRPRDPSQPRIVGSLYVDVATAQLVRLAFTFTRAAYLDPRNEDVSLVLENGLVEGRFWLPRRQEIEVRRAGTFLDFPARGYVRGRWEIGDYAVNAGLADSVRPVLAGPPLQFAPAAQLRGYPFPGRVVDALPPGVGLATDEEVRQVRAGALALVQARALTRARGAAVSARSASDFARVTRAEGLALGGGFALRPTPGTRLALQGRVGEADRQAKARLTLGTSRPDGLGLRAELARDYLDAGDAAETSRARNSLAAQEFGSDWTDPVDVRSAALALDLPVPGAGAGPLAGVRVTLGGAYEAQRAVAVRARPFAGRYEPTLAADRLRLARVTLAAERVPGPAPFGGVLAATVRVAGARTTLGCAPDGGRAGDGGFCSGFARAALAAQFTRPFGDRRLVLATTAAGAAGRVPVQELALLGGPVTAPGFGFHRLAGRAGASQRVEWQTPVPFPSVSLGRYGRSPATVTLAPYAHAAAVWRPEAARAGRPAVGAGAYPSAGLGAIGFFDLLRVDVARGLGREGRWLFSVDMTRDFWRVL